MEKRDFFISYTQADKNRAVWIADVLKKNKYTVYFQALDIVPGDSFLTKMNEFLENSGNFIAVWSKAYSESRFCMTEFEAAFNLWNKKRLDCFFSVRVDNYPIKPLYAVLVHADLFGKENAEAERELINAVKRVTTHSRTETNPEPEQESDKGTGSATDTNSSKKPRRFVKCALVTVFAVALILFGYAGLPRIQEAWEAYNLYQTGENYYYGKNGVSINYAKARNYYEQAAEKGHAGALNNLGVLYYCGYSVAKDYVKARNYYEQAAAKGSNAALNNLGNLYYGGYGVARNYAQARDYYEQAAAKGNAYALNSLGVLYENGYGILRDYAKALEYYQKAVNAGYKDAAANVARVQEKMNG